jgi:glucan phosphoethanolaminetransferase (alkaline phosphatase superfamily)
MLNFKSLRTEWVTLLASLYLLIGFNMFLWEHLQEIVPAGLSGLWLSLAFAVLMLFAFNLIHVVCLPVCIEAGTYRVVHEWRGRGLLHESVRRTY